MEIHVDTVIRLMAVGASLLLLLLLLAGQVRPSLKLALTGLIVGGAAYLINTSPDLRLSNAMTPVVDLIGLVTPFWVWLFARILFERMPAKWMLSLLGLFYVTGWYLANFVDLPRGPGFYIIHITSLLLLIDMIYTAISGLRDDLVQKRRLIRIYMPVLVGIQSIGILSYELWFGTSFHSPIIQTINGSLIFALVLFAGLALMRTETDLLNEPKDEPSDPKNKLSLSASETVLNDKLVAAMNDGHYRETGLTIQMLAEHLDTPQHRLRALINQKLGHRNFSSFLNGYRIDEAREKLSDRDLVDLPILTIAMDLGYNSLAPFNRSFRSETGITPSEFRQSAIDQN